MLQERVPLPGLVIPPTPQNLIAALLKRAHRATLGALAEQLVIHAVGLEPNPAWIPAGGAVAGTHQTPQYHAVVALAIQRQHPDALDLAAPKDGLHGAGAHAAHARQVPKADAREHSPQHAVPAKCAAATSQTHDTVALPGAASREDGLPELDVTEWHVVHLLHASRLGHRCPELCDSRQVGQLVQVVLLHVYGKAPEPQRVPVPGQETPGVGFAVGVARHCLREGVVVGCANLHEIKVPRLVSIGVAAAEQGRRGRLVAGAHGRATALLPPPRAALLSFPPVPPVVPGPALGGDKPLLDRHTPPEPAGLAVPHLLCIMLALHGRLPPPS
mmetsp:Transcript_63115/g.174950  ORF Transcript_63115/g.174950 Transcript_63115/m.174950 type:complete len:330 (-) Transcript_63115:305-1294(-)